MELCADWLTVKTLMFASKYIVTAFKMWLVIKKDKGRSKVTTKLCTTDLTDCSVLYELISVTNNDSTEMIV